MGLGAILEPLSVLALLFGGAWINRSTSSSHPAPIIKSHIEKDTPVIRGTVKDYSRSFSSSEETTCSSSSSSSSSSDLDLEDKPLSPSLLPQREPKWRRRQLRVFKWTRNLHTPNTARFRNTWISRALARFPFLVECWYWALVYWVSHRRAFPCSLLSSTSN